MGAELIAIGDAKVGKGERVGSNDLLLDTGAYNNRLAGDRDNMAVSKAEVDLPGIDLFDSRENVRKDSDAVGVQEGSTDANASGARNVTRDSDSVVIEDTHDAEKIAANAKAATRDSDSTTGGANDTPEKKSTGAKSVTRDSE